MFEDKRVIPPGHSSLPASLPFAYWACTQPERPDNDDTGYAASCYKCMLVAHATLMTMGNANVELFHNGVVGGMSDMRKKFDEACARFGHVFPPLPEVTV